MKGTRFRHWLGKYAFRQPIPDEQMPDVLARVRSGEPEAIKLMIESHLRLGLALVARYVRTAGVVDDLVSAAFYAITYAVNRIAAGHLAHDNVTGYIVAFVHGELKRELAQRSVVYTPEHVDTAVQVPIGEFDVTVPPDFSLDVGEELDAIVKDDTDSKIIRMLLQGYQATDVAKELGVHKGNVSRRIARLRAAYQENLR